MSRAEPRSGGIQSVERAAQLLSLVADHQAPTVGELAVLLGVHKSTASRLVATLVATGLLEGGGNGPVRLGPETRRLGRVASGAADLAEMARLPLAALAARTGETATLSLREGDHAVTLAQSGGSHRIGVQSWVGARTPLHLTADGKVLLAHAELPDPTVSRSLAAELQRVRRDEWATARGELEENLNGVAVPLMEGGRCVAAICVSGPAYRVGVERFDVLVDQCRRAALEIVDLRGGDQLHTP